VIKLKKYTHLTLEEREKLYAWKEKGLKLREIGRKLDRSHSTLSRELKKNQKYGKQYLPCHAQARYERVSEKQRRQAPLKSPEIFLYVREHLRHPYYWTPETIAGRLKKETKGRLTITTECIYQYIHSKKAKRYKLWQYLPSGRKKRMVKKGRTVRNQGKVPNAVSISKRPKYINLRVQGGHWETDNMEGTRSSKTALSVEVERASRYVVLTKIPNQTKLEKTKAVTKRLSKFPKGVLRTLTMDNGKENYGHDEIARILDLQTYFCHAYTSWEKGSVERRIKDIRRFIPKKKPISYVSKDKILWIECWLNNKPMKCLDYATPYEKMQQLISKLEST
jgi:IS30 family transposase